MKKRYLGFLLTLVMLASLLSGCAGNEVASESAKADNDSSFSQNVDEIGAESPGEFNADAPMSEPSETPGAWAPEQTAAQTERKIIRNAEFSMETLEYDKTVQGVQALADRFGGYIESSQTTGAGAADNYYRARWASFTLRIPAEELDAFADSLAQYGSVTDSRFYTDEVTDYYYDTEAHLKSLQLQEERLLDILSKADTLSDVATLENSLADVRYQIESLQGSLRRLDSLIALSTVSISVQEVYEYSPDYGRAKGLGERISDEFGRSAAAIRRAAEDCIVFVLGNSLTVIPALALAAAALLLFRRRKKSPPQAKHPEKAPEDDAKQ